MTHHYTKKREEQARQFARQFDQMRVALLGLQAELQRRKTWDEVALERLNELLGLKKQAGRQEVAP